MVNLTMVGFGIAVIIYAIVVFMKPKFMAKINLIRFKQEDKFGKYIAAPLLFLFGIFILFLGFNQ